MDFMNFFESYLWSKMDSFSSVCSLSIVIARFLKVSPYVILCDICKVSLALDPPLLALDFSFDFRSGW